MTPSRSRTLQIVALGTLIYASLQPGTSLEDVLDRALLPARVAGELVRPFTWLTRGEVRAAESTLAQSDVNDRAHARALLERAQAHALPDDPELARGRGFVHAQVIERKARTPDQLTIQFDPRAPLAAGMPVVAGDVYVGRVLSLSPDRAGEALVELVTERAFRVGASVRSSDGTSVELVVGGVVTGPVDAQRKLHLAVHAPSSLAVDDARALSNDARAGGLASGLVVVAEREAEQGTDVWRGLANGYRLGEWTRLEFGGTSVCAVRAAIDLAAGPYQVVALARPEMAQAGTALACDPFDAQRWFDSRSLAPGVASIGREGRVLAHGRRAGIEAGAALRAGTVLVGRVETAGTWTSTVRLVGDAGFAVHGLAEISGTDAPLSLGRLVSLGRDGDELVFEWENRIDADSSADPVPTQHAELYTGGGDRSVPAGLHLGSTELPRARGEHELRVKPRVDARSLNEFQVWRVVLARGELDE